MPSAPIRVFLSYRRGDSKHVAARIGERLDDRFQLFMDVDTIRPGMNFSTVVRNAVGESDVLLAIIGPSWLSIVDESGRRRLDDQHDWVVEEVGEGLRRDIPVIPVLVDGARMPSRSELPPKLAELADRQAVRVDHESFVADAAGLASAIERAVPPASPAGERSADVYADPDYTAAVSAFFRADWPTAVEIFGRLVARHPGQRQLVSRLTKARSMQQLVDLDTRVAVAIAERRWGDAVSDMEQMVAIDPQYSDVAARLEPTRQLLRIQELQGDIRALGAAGQWQAVVAADDELARIDPTAANVDGLADRARTELKEADLATRYALGVRQLDQEDWPAAVDCFTTLLTERPHYRDCAELLAYARRELSGPRDFVKADERPPTPAPPQPDMPDAGRPSPAPVRRRVGRNWKVYLRIAVAAAIVAGIVTAVVLTNVNARKGNNSGSPGTSSGPSTSASPSASTSPSSSGTTPDENFDPPSAAFAATSPWRLQIEGDECWVKLFDASGSEVADYYEIFAETSGGFIQVRTSGSFTYRIYKAHSCTARSVEGAGETTLPLNLPASESDTAAFDASQGIEVRGRIRKDIDTPEDRTCWVAVRAADSGVVVAESEGKQGESLLLKVPATRQSVYLESKSYECDLSVRRT